MKRVIIVAVITANDYRLTKLTLITLNVRPRSDYQNDLVSKPYSSQHVTSEY